MNKENPNSFQFQIEQFSPKNIDKKIHNLRYSELSYHKVSIRLPLNASLNERI